LETALQVLCLYVVMEMRPRALEWHGCVPSHGCSRVMVKRARRKVRSMLFLEDRCSEARKK
jgi:hypothetical protein